MTLRARQGSGRSRSMDDRSRRNMWMNIGFGLTILAALVLLVIAGIVAWYNAHLAAVATVNGQNITKDDLTRQVNVNTFLIDYQRRRVRTLLSSGHMWATDANARISALDSQAASVQTNSLNQLVDGAVILDLSNKQGVPPTDAQVQARITETATTPELRHTWMIVVAPTLAAGETTATDAEKAAAKGKAVAASAVLKGGGDWVTVAKATSSDTATAPSGGDVGYIDKNSSLDTPFVNAIMAAPLNTPTDVVDGADGSYRIGRVTDVIAPVVDTTFQSQASTAGVSQSDLDHTYTYAVAQKNLNDKIVADAMAPAPQRHVYEIYMQTSASESGPSAIRTRHILYSPNHDPNNASKVAATDPAWDKAKALADATYAKLQKDATQFDALARAESDESAAKTTGGKLPYFSTTDQIDAAFAAAIFKPGLQPGQLLEPVKSAFGWHVIQVMHGPTDAQWADKLVAQATDLPTFQTLARDNSDKAEAAKGGDLGWIGRNTYQVSQALGDAMFVAPIGKVSSVLTFPGDGTYIFFVAAEETRVPTGDQAAAIQSNAFSAWYAPQRATYTIWKDPKLAGASG